MTEKYRPRVIPDPIEYVSSTWEKFIFWFMLGVLTLGIYAVVAAIIVWVFRR